MSRIGKKPITIPKGVTIKVAPDAIEEGRWSWTWNVPDEARRNAVREIRPWVVERFGPLDQAEPNEFATVWRAYDLP